MIINESFLRKYADDNNVLSRRSLIFESLSHSDSQDKFDIFISHSSLDKKCTLALIELLEKDGVKAYVDFIQDTGMNPNNVTIETAKKIKSRLNQCKALTYLSTSNTTNSKWCPWELGLSDGITNGKCAIFPVMDSVFRGQEYLGLYPYISYGKNDKGENKFWVNSPFDKNTYALLSDWINTGTLKKH